MASRYANKKLVINDNDYYEPLRESRGDKDIVHYATIKLRHPTGAERSSTVSTRHVWSYGDRLYKLANTYYNDPTYWWVIAWWNSYPTEATIRKGTILHIPLNLSDALNILKA